MTLKDYKEKYVTNSEFQHRGITIEKQNMEVRSERIKANATA